jgi:hypothetical protein
MFVMDNVGRLSRDTASFDFVLTTTTALTFYKPKHFTETTTSDNSDPEFLPTAEQQHTRCDTTPQKQQLHVIGAWPPLVVALSLFRYESS